MSMRALIVFKNIHYSFELRLTGRRPKISMVRVMYKLDL